MVNLTGQFKHSKMTINLAILLSGRGSNFVALYSAVQRGDLQAKITLVASNSEDAIGLKTAREFGIPTAVFERKRFSQGSDYSDYMFKILAEHNVDAIALAGYLKKIPPVVVRHYRNRILNIHPALLPKFGGKGMYGINVHRAVIESGENETGVTIHFVNEEYDEGKIILQAKAPVYPEDTPEVLAARVLKVEHNTYWRGVQKYIDERNK